MNASSNAAAALVERAILLALAAGMAASLALSAWGLAFMPGWLTGIAEMLGGWLLLATVAVGIAFAWRMQARAIVDADYAGCPRWLRRASYALMFAGGVLFFLPAVLMFSGIGPAFNGSTLPSTVPGGFGLLAYTSIFAQTWSMIAKAEAGA